MKTDFDYTFNGEEIEVIKGAVNKVLKDYNYLEKIETNVPDKINGLFSASGEYEVFVEANDSFTQHIGDLIEENKLTLEEILQYLYEHNYDYEWYGDNVNENKIRQELYNKLESVLDGLRPIDLRRFIENMEFEISIDMKPVALSILSEIESHCSSVSDLLTIEHLQKSEDLRELIWDKYDYISVYKDFADKEIFDYIPYQWIVNGIQNKNSSVAKAILEDVKNKKGYNNEDEEGQAVYQYVEENFENVVEKIRQDKELVREIISSDYLFKVDSIWVFYSMI